MNRKTKRSVLIETEQISFLINRSSTDFMICKKCSSDSVMLKPEKIASGTDIYTREIYRRIETGEVHFIEKSAEEIFVCIQTLTGDRFEQEIRIRRDSNEKENSKSNSDNNDSDFDFREHRAGGSDS